MERMPRLYRSVYPIGGVVFDGDRAPKTGAAGPRLPHRHQGRRRAGPPVQRVEPGRLLLGARHVLQVHVLLAAERFAGGLTEDQKRQLFDEHITWYRMYGMSMRPVPKTWEEFQEYWDHMCRNVLEDNWAAREVLDLSTMTKHPSLEWIPGLAVAAEPEGDGTVPGVRDRRPLRPAGA